jgi:spoIIIJ-associated protein
MSRRSEANGTTLREVLAEAIAGVLDCETEKVELSVTAPGIEDLDGDVRVQPEVGDADGSGEATESVGDPTADPVAGAPDDQAEPAIDADETDETDVAEDGGEVDRGEEALTPQDLDDEADAAADFLEGLLDAMDLPGDLRLRVHDDHAEIEVVEIGSGALIGRRGQTLEAIQELLRCALQREFQRRARVKVDAEGYRARRLEKLVEKAEEAIDLVIDTGEPQRLEPMDVFERKAVHQIVAEVEGLLSRSQGREPARRVIIERE